MPLPRRALLIATLATPRLLAAAEDPVAALRRGGVAAVFRHALAPGTFDPPGMRLGDCSTQRNLNDEGRAQATLLGDWFRRHGLQPSAVRSSPWCRCIDTATLAFSRAEPWAALGSPGAMAADAAQAQVLRSALAALPASGFQAWVTHNFVVSALCGVSTASAEGVVLGWRHGGVQVLARIAAP